MIHWGSPLRFEYFKSSEYTYPRKNYDIFRKKITFKNFLRLRRKFCLNYVHKNIQNLENFRVPLEIFFRASKIFGEHSRKKCSYFSTKNENLKIILSYLRNIFESLSKHCEISKMLEFPRNIIWNCAIIYQIVVLFVLTQEITQ